MVKHGLLQHLTVKRMAMLVLSGVLSVALFFSCRFAGQGIVDRVFLSPDGVGQRLSGDVDSFRTYVDENHIASTDAVGVGQWNRTHTDVRLTITGRNTIMTSGSYGAELMLSDSGMSLRTGWGEGFEFPVNFADGTYTVTIYHDTADRLYNIVDITAVVISAVAFLAVMLMYEHHVTSSILRLSRQVRQVSRGDLQLQIHAPNRDEIGQLAQDVDTMRLSIIDQLRREEDAWQANSQLITAISHDVRTPLTALMGYLDILADVDLPEETQHAYLDVCRSNARRLKDLTDELFGFFLVFGQRTPEQTLEEFDAATLMEQILLEAQETLLQQGFDIHLQLPEEVSGTLQVDLGHLRRVFDNLFSNLQKYADPGQPIVITETIRDGNMVVAIVNGIPTAANRVESTKIGLKTCEKLLGAMGGGFRQNNDGDRFTAEVTLPLGQI